MTAAPPFAVSSAVTDTSNSSNRRRNSQSQQPQHQQPQHQQQQQQQQLMSRHANMDDASIAARKLKWEALTTRGQAYEKAVFSGLVSSAGRGNAAALGGTAGGGSGPSTAGAGAGAGGGGAGAGFVSPIRRSAAQTFAAGGLGTNVPGLTSAIGRLRRSSLGGEEDDGIPIVGGGGGGGGGSLRCAGDDAVARTMTVGSMPSTVRSTLHPLYQQQQHQHQGGVGGNVGGHVASSSYVPPSIAATMGSKHASIAFGPASRARHTHAQMSDVSEEAGSVSSSSSSSSTSSTSTSTSASTGSNALAVPKDATASTAKVQRSVSFAPEGDEIDESSLAATSGGDDNDVTVHDDVDVDNNNNVDNADKDDHDDLTANCDNDSFLRRPSISFKAAIKSGAQILAPEDYESGMAAYVSRRQFHRLLGFVRPDLLPEHIDVIFNAMDVQRVNRIGIQEWLRLIDFIDVSFKLYENPEEASLKYASQGSSWVNSLKLKMTSQAYEACLDILVVLNCLLIIIQLDAHYESGHARWITNASRALLGFFAVELVVRCWVVGPKLFFKSFINKLDSVVLLACVVLQVTSAAGVTTPLLREASLFRLIRIVRLLALSHRFKAILTTIAQLYPALRSLIVILFAVYYFFAVLGVGFFKDVIVKGEMDERFMRSYYANNNYWENNFNDVPHAFVILFEIMIVNNW